jgi:ABC-type transport system involved in resistance to organic solvents, periplasmic component
MKRGLTNEAKIGAVTIVSLVLLYFGINYLKGINLFKPSNHYFVTFDNVKDVTVSSPVFVEGFKVGLVKSISYDYSTTDKISVEVNLENRMKINKGSYIIIEQSFLGGAELHIHLNKYVDDYYVSGSVIEGRMSEGMMDMVQSKILPGVEQMLPKLDSILGGLQTLVNSQALTNSLSNIEVTTKNLEQSTLALNNMLRTDIPAIVTDFKVISHNFTEMSEEMKGLDIKATMASVNATIDNLRITTEKLNSSDNSMGLLLNDKNLYLNLNETAGNASKLLLDLKENPKRYVHFSIF